MSSVINWFNLPVADMNRAIEFYSNILEIELTRMPSPDGAENAFFPDPATMYAGALSSSPNLQPGQQGAQIFFNVDGKMEATIQRISAAGGQILMPRTDIGEFGYIASFLDSEGNMLGLHSTK